MKLTKFQYHQIEDGQTQWTIKNLNLDELNLIVGTNTAGKSRTLTALSHIATLLNNYSIRNKENYWKTELTFLNNIGKQTTYKLEILEQGIREELHKEGELLLERSGGKGKIFSKLKRTFIPIAPPNDMLVLHVRRDREEFPFLEEIVGWSKFFTNFNFSADTQAKRKETGYLQEPKPISWNYFDKFPLMVLDKIIEDFKKVGYPIEEVFVEQTRTQEVIYFREEGIEKPIPHYQLSQGMYRTFFLLVHIHRILHKGYSTVLLIDDLAEGLDYRRAKNLGALLFEKLENSNIHLIATSNHSFLMDVVDIRYWNILIRDKKNVLAYNYKNSKEIFEEFEYSGLCNFDLYSSDYLISKIT